MKHCKFWYLFLLVCVVQLQTVLWAQTFKITGTVTDSKTKSPMAGSVIRLTNTSYAATSNESGNYQIENIPAGKYQLMVYAMNVDFEPRTIVVDKENIVLNIAVDASSQSLTEVEIQGERTRSFGVARLGTVEGTAIYEAKKNEVIVLKDLNANLAANTTRQIFSKVPGLNVWESDGGGIQLGIAARGLNPSRTADFNMRQNGYDIAADALGYPEAYYTPPMEALERIEIVRGAASLQYGTQFGGLVNFVLKKPPINKKIEVNTRQTIGSFGFYNTFNSVGGTNGKFSYLAYYQYKRGNGWRANSEFKVHTAFAQVNYQLSARVKIQGEYTFMYYLAHQAGGLTDKKFEQNPRQSLRARNWFAINWNLFALVLDYKLGEHTNLNCRNFALISNRKALGNLSYINAPDNMGERDLLYDDYKNYGNETRLIHSYQFLNGQKSTILVGIRLYQGLTLRKQGRGNSASDANFTFNNPDNLEYSNHQFPNTNLSFFAENVFKISPKFSITPGLRIEYIKTNTEGYYRTKIPFTAESLSAKMIDKNSSVRSFPFFGIGLSYKPSEKVEIYANASQNYKAINFNDLRLNNANLVVDPNLKDERGYNIDLGFRGDKRGVFNYDISAFYMAYNSRISSILKASPDSTSIFRFRTNLANSTAVGVESFGELDFAKLFSDTSKWKCSWFINLAWVDARYHSANKSLDKKLVEMAPPLMARTGITLGYKKISCTALLSYVAQQYSDASNAKTSSTSVEGMIPSYYVCDFNASYTFGNYGIFAGINNVTNNLYFTRRAASYPGPGIIPSDGRNVYVTVSARF